MAINIDPYDWVHDAACRDLPTSWWFPGVGESFDLAQSICETCPVRVECLDYALARPELTGIWGGLTDRRRKRMRSKTLAAKR